MKVIFAISILFISANFGFADQSDVNKDSLYVRGKAVVFFGPSQAEYVSMTDKQKDAIDEALYDFYHYRNKVLMYLESNEIQAYTTAGSKIQIQFDANKSITYFRADFGHVVGIIMTDGQHEPGVFLGPATDADLISMFAEYFDLQ